MATLSQSESRRLYSWWWDSHISPKNSKWLQENLKDMDVKVKSMIKLIEEDADSFARRAEMYYKKRPELMKFVEEFYRAYRALAERYNHATGELRHAHRTIAKAFPDQVPFELFEDSPSKFSASNREPTNKQEIEPTVNTLLDIDDSLEDVLGLCADEVPALEKSGLHVEDSGGEVKRKGLNKMYDMFAENEGMERSSKSDKFLELSNENQNLREKVLHVSDRAGKAEIEVQDLKKLIADTQAEKESALLQYQRCLEKLSNVEGELDNALKDSMRLNEKVTGAEIEVQTLKEALIQLEVEKNAGLIKHNMYLENISNLEVMHSRFEEDMRGLDQRAIQAESESQILKNEISKLALEKEGVYNKYQQCLQNISDLKNTISCAQDEAGLLKTQAERAETEVCELKKTLADLRKEKENSTIRYKCCLEVITKLEKDLSSAKEDLKRLNDEVLIGNAKLKTAEESYTLLELSNQSLQVEADNLVKKLVVKDLELSEKQQELEKLQMHLQDEHLCRAQIKTTLETLEHLHSKSQDDQRNLAQELKYTLQSMKNLEVCKLGLEEEIMKVRDENDNLSRVNFSSNASVENMKNELLSLQELKDRLELEVSHHLTLSNSLEEEISLLKVEIVGLNTKHLELVKQVKSAGMDPKSVGTSIKNLQHENSKLTEMCEQNKVHKEILWKKLENTEEVLKEKILVESSLSDLNGELVSSRAMVTELQESCKLIHEEKATLVTEKASLLSQLQAITENMHNLMEKNSVLDNSLSATKVELECLREKSRGLEEICELLKNDRSNLLTERSTLVSNLENVERRLKNLEYSFMGLEVKYADLEREKEAMNYEMKELKESLSVEKQERSISEFQSETRLARLENDIHHLQEENKWKKKEFEEELEKALKSQFEIIILQKFMKDMEEKNYSLIVECQKHVEASKLAEKLISELESESLEQQVEAELLLDEIECLRLGIYQVFKAVATGLKCVSEDYVENERMLVHHILETVEDMKCSISRHEDDKQQLLIEKSVLLTLLKQLESTGMKIESKNMSMEQEFKIIVEKLAMITKERDELQNVNKQLKSSMNEGHRHVSILEAELGSLCAKQGGLHKLYNALQDVYSQVNQENKYLLKKISLLQEEKCEIEQHNDAVLLEFLATGNECDVVRSFGTQKTKEVNLLLKDLDRLHESNCSLENEMTLLKNKLELEKTENHLLKNSIHRLEMAMQGLSEYNFLMKQDILSGKESLMRTEKKLSDTQMKFEAAENLNSSLCKTVDELKMDRQMSLQMKETFEKSMAQISEKNTLQKKETESLLMVNKKLESELCVLLEEMEGKIMREQTLSSKLQDKANEFKLWLAEAETFFFDLQVSSTNEVFLQSKVNELSGAFRNLAYESASKVYQIEQMKGTIGVLEGEIGVLKSQLFAYSPVVESLRDDISFLENNALLKTNSKAPFSHKQCLETAAPPGGNSFEEFLGSQSPLSDGISSLQNLQVRIKAVGKLMERMNKPVSRRRSNSNINLESETSEFEDFKPRRSVGRDRREHTRKKGTTLSEINDTPKLQKIRTKSSRGRNGMMMKDIPLDQVSGSPHHAVCKRSTVGASDQMLELWETAEDRNRSQRKDDSLRLSYKMTERDIVYDQFDTVKKKTEPPSTDSDLEKELGVDMLEVSTKMSELSREVSSRRILERLASDAEKLDFLHTTVQNLTMKLEANRKGKNEKTVDLETMHEQLMEAEETVMYLEDLNGKLVKNIEEIRSPGGRMSPQLKEAARMRRKKVTEQARKGSESIGRLQLELQKIQYILLKLDDEKKNKGKSKFFKNKTIVLRDFIYNGRKNSGKRKKSSFCGCLRTPNGFERSP